MDEDQARDRTIAQAEANAQAMVDELERLVEQLRLARAETGDARGHRARVGVDVDVDAAEARAEALAAAETVAPQDVAPQDVIAQDSAQRTLNVAHPLTWRPRLSSVLGLAAVALVGVVGAATITVVHDTSMSADSAGNGMEPIPYARTTPEHADAGAGADRSTLPLGAPGSADGAGRRAERTRGGRGSGAAGGDAAPSSGATGDAPAGGLLRQLRSAPGVSSAQSELNLIAGQFQSQALNQALRQAASDAEAAELQALARSFMPTPSVPQLPTDGGWPSRSR